MSTVQLDGVIDVEACLVVTALVAHVLPPLVGRGCRWRRVAVGRHLGFEVFWIHVHEGSLCVILVLGSARIVACEPSLSAVREVEA
ncbi:hypothetical protein D3C78_1479250 [compost metagenome]